MSNLTKTIKLRIYVTPEQEELFHQLTEQYRQACNFVSQYIFENSFDLTYQKLNQALYSSLRGLFGLKSQMAQSSVKTAIARYKTVRQQLIRKPYRYKDQEGNWQRITKTLEWLWKSISFTRPQADLVRNRDYSFVDNGRLLSINTLGKRIRCRFAGEHFAEYLDGSYDFCTAKLVKLKGLWYLHIPVTSVVDDFRKENVRHVVGIDRGLRFLTVSYDEQGKTEFVSLPTNLITETWLKEKIDQIYTQNLRCDEERRTLFFERVLARKRSLEMSHTREKRKNRTYTQDYSR